MTDRQRTMLKKVIDDYNSIEAVQDLSRKKLTLTEYIAIPRIIETLSIDGEAETFITGIAHYFRKQGFKIVLGTVNYHISFD